jgi:hypothetical protein
VDGKSLSARKPTSKPADPESEQVHEVSAEKLSVESQEQPPAIPEPESFGRVHALDSPDPRRFPFRRNRDMLEGCSIGVQGAKVCQRMWIISGLGAGIVY